MREVVGQPLIRGWTIAIFATFSEARTFLEVQKLTWTSHKQYKSSLTTVSKTNFGTQLTLAALLLLLHAWLVQKCFSLRGGCGLVSFAAVFWAVCVTAQKTAARDTRCGWALIKFFGFQGGRLLTLWDFVGAYLKVGGLSNKYMQQAEAIIRDKRKRWV